MYPTIMGIFFKSLFSAFYLSVTCRINEIKKNSISDSKYSHGIRAMNI